MSPVSDIERPDTAPEPDIRVATVGDVPRIVALIESAYRGDSSRTGWTTEADLLDGRRTDEASWRAGHAWWEGCGLAQARQHAARLSLWIALVGQGGSTVDEDFPGLAALVGPDGSVTTRLPDWRPGTLVVDIPC